MKYSFAAPPAPFAVHALAVSLAFFLATPAGAAEAAGNDAACLPPPAAVVRVLLKLPEVQAADSTIQAEEANRERLRAGPYEWSVRVLGQQRRTAPATGPNERFNEWNAAIERPLRLPGKSAKDAELGERGVDIARLARGDALHEASRALLGSWFAWLRERGAAAQWRAQAALLKTQADAVQRRQQLGDAARIETIQAEAALAQAQAQQTQSEARLRSAEETLRRQYPELPLTAPDNLPEPQAVSGDRADWVEATLAENHQLALARLESLRARALAERARQDRLPDPSIGLQYGRERGGEEHIVGAYISIPLPGAARRAGSDAAQARAAASERHTEAIARTVGAETAALYQTARAGRAGWLAARQAAERLSEAADMTARAYRLGEGTLNEVLLAHRLANDARLAAGQSQVDALEAYYRLLLDTHRLWHFDEED